MSTRANIVIEYTDKDTNEPAEHWLYHHWDGYVQGIGEEIVQAVHDYRQYLDSKHDLHYLLNEFKRSYEDTGSMHGDIEFLYRITFSNNEVKIKARHGGYTSNNVDKHYSKANDTEDNSVTLYQASYQASFEGDMFKKRTSHITNIMEAYSYTLDLIEDVQKDVRAWRGEIR